MLLVGMSPFAMGVVVVVSSTAIRSIGRGRPGLERWARGHGLGASGGGACDGGGAGSGEVLLADLIEELAAADPQVAGGGYAEANLIAADGDDGDLDVVTYEEPLTVFPG